MVNALGVAEDESLKQMLRGLSLCRMSDDLGGLAFNSICDWQEDTYYGGGDGDILICQRATAKTRS
jgi:hypothetical protein